ncbi:MAG: coproporphyrinogen-III oxidase [Planctomycetota bacterium]|nr:MAG: coproporphyrinogen-III oxidase [Planctomycetota bacterium]
MSELPFGLDEALLSRLAVSGPRYTSYPTAPEWSADFGPGDASAAYARAAQRPDEPLSLYVHLPFCSRLCLYCGCTVEISGRPDRADSYLDAVERELELLAPQLGARRTLTQLHWGGGTPTFLSVPRLQRLHALISKHFTFRSDAEVSVEVDPHVTSAEQVSALVDLGFNRVSMGVQDLDARVQHAVRREQTSDETHDLVAHCRAAGVEGLNIDLMYGLPEQTEQGFAATLDAVAALAPDRLAVFGYAHVPWLKPAQKALEDYALPDAPTRARLFGLALQKLVAADYQVVGLDHFAKRDDSLMHALRDGRLHRNFMGYAVRAAEDMLGVGMSSIGEVAGAFIQNARDTKTYEAELAAGRLPVIRGLHRSAEDELRRAVILSLMCQMRISWPELEQATGRTQLAAHFASEWEALKPFADLGMCTMSSDALQVTEVGRLFLRHMAMLFDESLAKRAQDQGDQGPRFSKTL